MSTAINSAISPFVRPTTEPNANATRFLDENLASVPASDIPEDFRKLSRFLPVIVLGSEISCSVYGEWSNELRKHTRVGKTISVGSE